MTLPRSESPATAALLTPVLALALAAALAAGPAAGEEPPVTFLEPFPDVLESAGIDTPETRPEAPDPAVAAPETATAEAPTPEVLAPDGPAPEDLETAAAAPHSEATAEARIPPPAMTPPNRRDDPTPDPAAPELAAVAQPALTDAIGGPLTPDMLPEGAEGGPFRGSAMLAEAIGPSVARDVAFGFAPRIAWAPVTATFVVAPGDTLAGMFTDVGVSYAAALEAIEQLTEVWDPRRLQIGQQVALTFMPAFADETAATLVGFAIDLAYDRRVVVMRDDFGQYTVRDETIDYRTALARAAGGIAASLYADGNAAGIPDRILVAMTRAFSYDVDFQRDIHPGDGFEAVFEQSLGDDGAVVATGPLVYASLTLDGDEIAIYRFTRGDDSTDFFTADGVSVVKALLRTPVDAARISSSYGMRRHPILGYSRMHSGTDFAAPTGTPIYAAGDGTVAEAGWNRGYGNYVRIRHNGSLQTAYGHMSRFARGLSAGDRVSQGQVIGFVGSTGMSTGPHLHFEVIVNGAKVDPLSVQLPPGEALVGADLERFNRWRTQFDATRLALPLGGATGPGETQISTAQ